MNNSKAKMTEGIITPELVAEMESKKGLKLRVENAIFNEYATRDNIRKFINGIGEMNPLFHDEEYAEKSRYGCVTAPPSFIMSVLSGVQFGWRGLAGYHSASEMEFYKPIKVGDQIIPEKTYTGFTGPKESGFSGKTIFDYFDKKFFNSKNELISKEVKLVIRAERKQSRGKGKYQNIQLPHPWTDEELQLIEEEVLAQKIRGNNPRFWEDVEVGEVLPQLIKGPLGMTDMVAAVVAGLALGRLYANERALQEYKKQPEWFFRDPLTHAWEPIFAVHYNLEAAKAMGLPYPYDIGTQRHCWFIQSITNWMGDDGWLKRCYAEYRSFVYFSDVIRISGTVTEKFIDQDGEYCVKLKTHAFNQRGENVMPGEATVSLPSRNNDFWPVERRV